MSNIGVKFFMAFCDNAECIWDMPTKCRYSTYCLNDVQTLIRRDIDVKLLANVYVLFRFVTID